MPPLPERNPAFHSVGERFETVNTSASGQPQSGSIFNDIFGGISAFAEGAAGAAESVFGSLTAYEAAAREYNQGGYQQIQAQQQAKTQQYILLGLGAIALILLLK